MSGSGIKTKATPIHVYLKCQRSAQVQTEHVTMRDIASIRCREPSLCAKLYGLTVHRFGERMPKRHVVSTLRLVELMEEVCPEIAVQVIGEPDVLIEYVTSPAPKPLSQNLKAVLICLVSFFGTGFTIMAYHNDIGINDIFTEAYRLVLGREPQGINALEVAYSLGVALGIILFFNHLGGKKMTKDPTPIQVAMRNYEQDVDHALIESAEREGKEEDCRR